MGKEKVEQTRSTAFGFAQQWFAGRSVLSVGILVAAGVLLAKLPLIFTTLGEHDQGRMIMDAVVYNTDGPSTLRKYGIFTSPLWTLVCAAVVGVVRANTLVLLSNIGGWLCGGLNVVFAFILLHRLGASRGWAASGAVVATVLPGTFYLSLYEYPSQYAMCWLLASGVAFMYGLALRAGAGLFWQELPSGWSH